MVRNLCCFIIKVKGATTRTRVASLRLQLHGAIYRPDSFVLMLRFCANLKAIRYKSTSLNRIVADKSHRVIAAEYRHKKISMILIILYFQSECIEKYQFELCSKYDREY